MAVHPPSTIKVEPVIYDAASELKKTIGKAISWGKAILLIGDLLVLIDSSFL